jgi:predicted aspartyl protease
MSTGQTCSVSIEFSLTFKSTPLGMLGDPRIRVTVRTPTVDEPFDFLLDTGADCSLAPRWLADRLGLDWETLPSIAFSSAGPGMVRARLGSLRLRMQERELTVRCLFLDSGACPLVLGWADFLDRFVLTIDPLRRRIVLDDAL